MPSSMDLPLVSVRLMTYNHESYIGEAIESCLAQETNFHYEIIIGDDFSTDRTLDICIDYQKKYPHLIHVLPRKKGDLYHVERQKKGRLFNFTDIIANCKGRYIALLDGDDYWNCPLKLSKQIEFLQSHPNFAFTFHDCLIKTKTAITTRQKCNIPKDISQKDLITFGTTNFVPSASILFDRECLPRPFPDWYYDQPMGDWPLTLILLEDGRKARYIDAPMSVYRNQGQGLWEGASNLMLLIEKRNFINNLQYTDLGIDRSTQRAVLGKYDKKIGEMIRDMEAKDYRNMNISRTLRYLFYRVKYAFLNSFKK